MICEMAISTLMKIKQSKGWGGTEVGQERQGHAEGKVNHVDIWVGDIEWSSKAEEMVGTRALRRGCTWNP